MQKRNSHICPCVRLITSAATNGVLLLNQLISTNGRRKDLGAFINILRQNIHRDFHHALRFDVDTDGAGDARHLFGGGNFLFHKMLGNRAGFARTANHPEKLKRSMNPCLQHERVMFVSARNDESKRRCVRERLM